MTALTAEALRAAAPQADPERWLDPLTQALARYQIDTPRRIAAALGQFAVEAGPALAELVEDLTYTHAARIAAVWPREFPTAADAAPYVRRPGALAARVYAGRNGNGDEASGDGWRFRGRGLVQLSGRDDYTAAAAAFRMPLDSLVEWAATPPGAAETGCWYLADRHCLPLADAWEIDAITRAVNGAGMEDATARRQAADAALQAYA